MQGKCRWELTESEEAVNTLNNTFHSIFLNKIQRLNNSLQKDNEEAMGMFCASDLFPFLLIQQQQPCFISYPSKQKKFFLEYEVNRSSSFQENSDDLCLCLLVIGYRLLAQLQFRQALQYITWKSAPGDQQPICHSLAPFSAPVNLLLLLFPSHLHCPFYNSFTQPIQK